MRARALLIGLGVLMGVTVPAWAQGGTTETETQSTSGEIVFNPETVTTERTVIYQTRIFGRLLDLTVCYDQTFSAPFDDPSVQAAVAAARQAIIDADEDEHRIVGPALTDSDTTTTTGSRTTTYSLAGSAVSVEAELTVGPGTVKIGDRDTAADAIAALPSTTAPVRGPDNSTMHSVLFGEINLNTNLHTIYTIAVDTVIEETETRFEEYTLSTQGPAPEPAPLELSIERLADGAFLLKAEIEKVEKPDPMIRVDASEDMREWQFIGYLSPDGILEVRGAEAVKAVNFFRGFLE